MILLPSPPGRGVGGEGLGLRKPPHPRPLAPEDRGEGRKKYAATACGATACEGKAASSARRWKLRCTARACSQNSNSKKIRKNQASSDMSVARLVGSSGQLNGS